MPSEPGSRVAAPSRCRRSQYSWNQPTWPISQMGGSTKCWGAPSIWAGLSPSSNSSSTRRASSSAARSGSAAGRSAERSIVWRPVPQPSVSAVGRVCTPCVGARPYRAPNGRVTLAPTFRPRRFRPMKSLRISLALAFVAALLLAAFGSPAVQAQGQTIKIGILFDHSGPFSAAGSLNCWRGAKMMIDLINERGGVLGKYKIVQVDGDSQSKAEVAINEAERLLNVEKVDILAGVYSSAHAVPLAEKVDKQQKFLWITTAIADAVLKDRNLQYTFRPQPNGSLFGENTVQYVAHFAQEKLKKAPKDVRAAIIYEDGPYVTGVAASNESEAKKLGMQVVLKEG